MREVRAFSGSSRLDHVDVENGGGKGGSNLSTPRAGGCHLYPWGGRFHPVPRDFLMPRLNVKCMFDLWCDGNMDKDIGPFKFIKAHDLVNTKDKGYWSNILKR